MQTTISARLIIWAMVTVLALTLPIFGQATDQLRLSFDDGIGIASYGDGDGVVSNFEIVCISGELLAGVDTVKKI